MIMGGMWCYLWYEVSNPNECKFGERWVYLGEDPVKEIKKRIYASLGVRKDLWRAGKIVLLAYWDVSEIAIKAKRNYPHGRVDDYIRPHIGHRKGSTGEIHSLPADLAKLKVDNYIVQSKQPLPYVGLSAWQAKAAEQVLGYIQDGKKIIIAELCARAGKTIWAGALVRETNVQLTVVASYVLTSFSSFQKDLSGFEQFKDYVLIDTADDEYQEVINNALANGKQVVAFISMCAGAKRKEKIEYLFGLDCTRMLIIDEADYGVHQAKQAKLLIENRKSNDVAILMTGTNADRAVNYWKADAYLSLVYPELVMYKRLNQSNYTTSLTHFKIDAQRHNLVVDVQFYLMSLTKVMDQARIADPELFTNKGAYLPSWTKFAEDPQRAKGLWTRMLEAIFLGQHGLDELNVDYQTRRGAKEGQRVAMMFISGGIKNANLAQAALLAQSALPAFEIVAIYGDEMTNATSEKIVLDRIEKAQLTGKNLLILSARMAQRSFSVGKITELYLAYDGGEKGATIQKISRALTPDSVGKVARVISLSFDSQRDDKFDTLLLETALNYKKSHNVDSARHALNTVIRTVDIFDCTPDGAVKFDPDVYLDRCMESNSLTRVVGKTSDIDKLSLEEMQAIANGRGDVFKLDGATQVEKGRACLPTNNYSSAISNTVISGLDKAKLREKVTKVITRIVENMDIIVYGTGTKNLKDAFDTISSNADMIQSIQEEFDLDYRLIQHLLDRKIINNDLLELRLDQILGY